MNRNIPRYLLKKTESSMTPLDWANISKTAGFIQHTFGELFSETKREYILSVYLTKRSITTFNWFIE